MQPQQPSKKTVKAKAKVVAKKPTAQSVAAQRTAMIKKMKGDTAKPAAKKVMPKMAKGSGCVPKMADGTGKVKAPSTAAKRASTATASKVKITEKPSIDTRLNRVSNDLNKQYKRLENIRTVDRRSDASTKLQDYNDASRSIMRLEIEKPLAIEEKRKRNATLEKAVSGKMKSGSGCVSKYPDGSGKIKPTSTAARRASTATETPKKRVGNIKTKEGRKLDSLYNAKDNLDATIVFKEAIASGLDPKGFNSPTGQKNWNKSKANRYARLQAETNDAEKKYEDSWKKRNATLEKAVSGKMKSGSGCVSKYPDGSGKIKPTSTAARRASTATEMPKKRKPMTDEEEIRAVRGPKMNVNIYNYDTQREIRGVYEAQDKAREIKKLQQRQRDRKLEKAVSGKMKSGTKKVKC